MELIVYLDIDVIKNGIQIYILVQMGAYSTVTGTSLCEIHAYGLWLISKIHHRCWKKNALVFFSPFWSMIAISWSQHMRIDQKEAASANKKKPTKMKPFIFVCSSNIFWHESWSKREIKEK